MRIAGIIPARYASTRLDGKALAMIGDKPMILHVLENVRSSRLGSDVFVATDDQRIADVVTNYGGRSILTDKNHPSGTDRVQEAVHMLPERYDFVINIQGDEPFLDPDLINALVDSCHPGTEIGTLIQQITDLETLKDPNIVKVVKAVDGKALYFSRSPIPYNRNEDNWLKGTEYWKHIGMYLYRTDVLDRIHSLPGGRLEAAESLEQLRWLENGLQIDTTIVAGSTLGVDTPADLQKAREIWNKLAGK